MRAEEVEALGTQALVCENYERSKSAASKKNSGVVAAIDMGGAYCNASPLIPQGLKRKMFLIAEIFLKLFFDIEKNTRP